MCSDFSSILARGGSSDRLHGLTVALSCCSLTTLDLHLWICSYYHFLRVRLGENLSREISIPKGGAVETIVVNTQTHRPHYVRHL